MIGVAKGPIAVCWCNATRCSSRCCVIHEGKANLFFAIKEEDSGHFVTLTKRMFTQKIWQSFDGYFRDDDLHDALACLG